MEALFHKLTQKKHILESFQQTLEKFVLPDGTAFRKFVPGIDGLGIRDFEKQLEERLEDCRQFLLKGDREFLPQLLRQVPKNLEGEVRDVYLSSLRDKVVQKAMALALWPELDRLWLPNLYSYRYDPRFHQAAALKRAKQFLKRHGLDIFLFKTDIKEYTENIRHDLLLEKFAARFPNETRFLGLIKIFLRQKRYIRGQVAAPALGIPTGSPLTPLLANFYLEDLDRQMYESRIFYIRYGDDILVMDPHEEKVRAAAQSIRACMQEKKLTLSADKTLLQSAQAPFHYLGYKFDRGKIRVGEKALLRYRAWIKETLDRKKYRTWPNRSPQEKKLLLRRVIKDLQTEMGHADNLLAWIKSFPFLDDDTDLRALDQFVKDRVRICVTRETTPKNRQKIPESWFRNAKFRSFTGAYHRVRHRRPLGPYQDWEKYFSESRAAPEPSAWVKPLHRLRRFAKWVREALASGANPDNRASDLPGKSDSPEPRRAPPLKQRSNPP